MASISESLGLFFGPSNNDQFARVMTELVGTMVEAAAHFRKTDGRDLEGTIAYERKGDRQVDAIHEILDNAFIMRFDIPDAMRLADELDNVLDGMRKTAMHIDIYKSLLKAPQLDAQQLMTCAERMVGRLRDLVVMFSEPRLSLPRVREIATAIDEDESEADRLAANAERRLVGEYSPPGANRLEFLAWLKLYQHLEEMTDHANHCAKLIVSLARKEA